MIGDNAVSDEEHLDKNVTDDEDITDVDELLVEEVSIDGMCGVY